MSTASLSLANQKATGTCASLVRLTRPGGKAACRRSAGDSLARTSRIAGPFATQPKHRACIGNVCDKHMQSAKRFRKRCRGRFGRVMRAQDHQFIRRHPESAVAQPADEFTGTRQRESSAIQRRNDVRVVKFGPEQDHADQPCILDRDEPGAGRTVQEE